MSRTMQRISGTKMNNTLNREVFNEKLRAAGSICILGHVSPDGDCVGSVLAVYNYIRHLKEGGSFTLQAYLEEINPKFSFLSGADRISAEPKDGKKYELAVVCDCADENRLGRFRGYLENAEGSLVVDHHFTNAGFGDACLIVPQASSTCEVLYDLMEEPFFRKDVAECIYTGLVHDTGVFRHNTTSSRTMAIAGKCMDLGIPFGEIIEESFFAMDFEQKKVLGYLLTEMQQRAGGKMICGWLDMETRKKLHAETADMDGMIDQMRTTSGAVMALYMYETKDGRIKASMRSNSDAVDVSLIAMMYGGGGHKRAAGCFMDRDFEKNADLVEAEVKRQLEAFEKAGTGE